MSINVRLKKEATKNVQSKDASNIGHDIRHRIKSNKFKKKHKQKNIKSGSMNTVGLQPRSNVALLLNGVYNRFRSI
jgi:hypothetical protein